jgi:ParB-like chromosome segregation protein Spo0J
VVVPDATSAAPVVIDGYKRVRALRRLKQEVVQAVRWDVSESDALLMGRAFRQGGVETALEQAWLLEELRRRFGFSLEELARRFDRTVSWVSRRLALIAELPESVQGAIRHGQIVAHAAAKYLVPLARANRPQCESLARAISQAQLSSREVGLLYSAWRDGSSVIRERIVSEPLLYLKARQAQAEQAAGGVNSPQELLQDVAVLAALSRRTRRRIQEGVGALLGPLEGEEVKSGLALARAQIDTTLQELKPGENDARPQYANGDPNAHREGALPSPDRAKPQDFAGHGSPDPGLENGSTPCAFSHREGRALSPVDCAAVTAVQGESGAGP